jgi:hypothetical protein
MINTTLISTTSSQPTQSSLTLKLIARVSSLRLQPKLPQTLLS